MKIIFNVDALHFIKYQNESDEAKGDHFDKAVGKSFELEYFFHLYTLGEKNHFS